MSDYGLMCVEIASLTFSDSHSILWLHRLFVLLLWRSQPVAFSPPHSSHLSWLSSPEHQEHRHNAPERCHNVQSSTISRLNLIHQQLTKASNNIDLSFITLRLSGNSEMRIRKQSSASLMSPQSSAAINTCSSTMSRSLPNFFTFSAITLWNIWMTSSTERKTNKREKHEWKLQFAACCTHHCVARCHPATSWAHLSPLKSWNWSNLINTD